MLGAWCLALGAWCLVLGAWCLVPGAWCLVPGALCLVLCAWCLVPGATAHCSWGSCGFCSAFGETRRRGGARSASGGRFATGKAFKSRHWNFFTQSRGDAESLSRCWRTGDFNNAQDAEGSQALGVSASRRENETVNNEQGTVAVAEAFSFWV